MTPDREDNKTLSSIFTDLLVRDRKLKIAIVFISKSYFKVPKDIRVKKKHYFVMKILTKKELIKNK